MGKPLVFQSDFGYDDGAVSAMYGVAYSVSGDIKVFDVTHNIPQYNIWEASYRLIQTVNYWPKGTVFVSVVDPGVGSTRRSIVALTEAGQYIVTPDNGTLTHIKRLSSVCEARVIDESVNRLPNSGESYTFHGRDIYAYTDNDGFFAGASFGGAVLAKTNDAPLRMDSYGYNALMSAISKY